MPRTVSASEAKNRLGSIVGWVLENEDEVIVQSHGAPTIVIISYTEYEKMKALKEQDRRRESLERLRKLRDRVMAQNKDLTPEEGDALADQFSREIIEDMAKDQKIRFES